MFPRNSRRRFLAAALQVGAAALAWCLPKRSVGDADVAPVSDGNEAVYRRLLSVCGAPREIGSLAAACRRALPEGECADSIVAAIAGTDERHRWFQRADRASVAQELCAMIRRDFTAGHVIDVQGWVLAQTEARLFALHHPVMDAG
jgi:hypothetical protein